MQAGAVDSPQLLFGCLVVVVEVGEQINLGEQEVEEEGVEEEGVEEEQENLYSQLGQKEEIVCLAAGSDPLCYAKPVVG